MGKTGARFIEHLANANNDAKPGLMRLASFVYKIAFVYKKMGLPIN
jgi:hypothetical protein